MARMVAGDMVAGMWLEILPDFCRFCRNTRFARAGIAGKPGILGVMGFDGQEDEVADIAGMVAGILAEVGWVARVLNISLVRAVAVLA